MANSGGCVRGIETIFFFFALLVSCDRFSSVCICTCKLGREFELLVSWFYMEIREYLKRDRIYVEQ